MKNMILIYKKQTISTETPCIATSDDYSTDLNKNGRCNLTESQKEPFNLLLQKHRKTSIKEDSNKKRLVVHYLSGLSFKKIFNRISPHIFIT